MKLSKRDLKEQNKILALIKSKEDFTPEEKELIYKDFNEAILGDISNNSAYFTPLDMAFDFTLMVPTSGILIDMCAGIGVLSHAALTRDCYEGRIKKIICIERDSKYINIGKKLVKSTANTVVEWVQGDIFDKEMWDKIKKENGQIDCIISNPPFGSVSKTIHNRDWLKYTGSDLDIAAIEIAILNSKHQSFILPQGSCTFRASGRPYAEHVENRKISKLKKEMGIEFYMSWASIDTCYYEQQFKNTKVVVECCTIDLDN